MIINKMANNVGSDEVVHLGLYCLQIVYSFFSQNTVDSRYLEIHGTL